ncbi:hypothetical protein Bca4012_036863 [Brassica carinata]
MSARVCNEGASSWRDQMETGERRFKRSRSKDSNDTVEEGRWRPRGKEGKVLRGEATSVVGKRQKVPDGRSIVWLGMMSRWFLLGQPSFAAIARKNILIMEYEVALRKTVSELRAAEATMKAREEEFEKAKREVLKKAKELVAERDRHCRERRQAIQAAGDLEEELETARTKIAAMKQEKIDEAERTRKEMDRLRQSRLYEVMCERNRVTAGANRRFEKFRRYMIDRDKREEKLFLHSQASGTLDSIGIFGGSGFAGSKVLRICWSITAKYKKELAEVVVEEITERDLVLSPLARSYRISISLDPTLRSLTASAAALRSPVAWSTTLLLMRRGDRCWSRGGRCSGVVKVEDCTCEA